MKDQTVTRFWDNFIYKTKSYNIKSTAVRWYVKYAEEFLKTHPHHRLCNHSPAKIEQYLRDKGRSPYLKDWQFRQVVKSRPNNHVTLARDYQITDKLSDEASKPATPPASSAQPHGNPAVACAHVVRVHLRNVPCHRV